MTLSKESQTSLPSVGNRRFSQSRQKNRTETLISRLSQTEGTISGLEENAEEILKRIRFQD